MKKLYYWTTEKIEILRAEYPERLISTKDIAAKIGFPREAIISKANDLGIERRKTILTDAQIEVLAQTYPNTDTKHLAKAFNVSTTHINSMACKLGVHKSKEFLAEKGKANNKGQFKKNQIPHNKGVPMSREVYEKVKHTMFKKGTIPPNTKPHNGYIVERFKRGKFVGYYIRIELSKWIPLSHYIWAQNGFELPTKNEVLRFKDNDSRNCTIDNLEKISRKENRIRNGVYFKYAKNPTLLKVIRQLSAIKKRITHINRKIKNLE